MTDIELPEEAKPVAWRFWNDVRGHMDLGFGPMVPGSDPLVLASDYAAIRTVADKAIAETADLEAEKEALEFALRNGKSLAENSIGTIRDVLTVADVPAAAFIDDHVSNAVIQRDQERARAEAAEATVARLRDALRPFVEAYKAHDDPGVSDLDNEQLVAWHVPLGAFRRARAALSEPSPSNSGDTP